MENILSYCMHDACPSYGSCEKCRDQVNVERVYSDEIKVTLMNSGYRQRFWVDLTDQQAIERTLKMKEQNITTG